MQNRHSPDSGHPSSEENEMTFRSSVIEAVFGYDPDDSSSASPSASSASSSASSHSGYSSSSAGASTAAHILKSSQSEILVDLPSGKISKKGERKPIQSQEGMTCILYAMRRLSIFNDPDVKQSRLYLEFRALKKIMKEFDGRLELLVPKLRSICMKLNIDWEWVLINSPLVTDHRRIPPMLESSILYDAIIKQRVCTLMSLQQSDWQLSDGFNGLRKSLETHGAHVFTGKYGRCYHIPHASLTEVEELSSPERQVFGFKKDSFIGTFVQWTHAVIVDQASLYKGREMVFFRDPMDQSLMGKREQVYALSYESFTERLYSQPQSTSRPASPGIVSKSPSRLASHF